MSRAHYLSSAAAFALLAGVSLGAAPAMADVDVVATIEKEKDIEVLETIEKQKTVDIDVDLDEEVEQASEGAVIVNQRIDGDSQVNSTQGQQAAVSDSVNNNTGSTNFNNAAGYFNQQGNVLSGAIEQNPEGDSFAEVQASAEQIIQDNTTGLQASGNNSATTTNSVIGNQGVTQYNNVAGAANQQLNVAAFATSFSEVDGVAVALDESDLGQTLTNNFANGGTGINTASVTGSVNGNTGVTNFNQAAGIANQQANIVQVAANSPASLLFTP